MAFVNISWWLEQYFKHLLKYIYIKKNHIKDKWMSTLQISAFNRLPQGKGKQKTFKIRLVSPSGIWLLGYCLGQQKKLFFELGVFSY